MKDDVRIFGIITEGGVSPNIIPERAVTRLQIRVEDEAYFQEVIEKVKDAVRGAALATGTELTIRKYANTYVNMLTNLALAEEFKRKLTALKMPVETFSQRGVATDMGNVSQVVPAIHPFIAIAPKGMALHSIESTKASASPQAYDATVKTAKALGMTTIDIFSDPELAKKIKKEFAQANTRKEAG
ncbi:MAG: hypothetical protein JSV50_15485 [Desulfobacteraceae bacterium]|nr:MAG: hypothetical protein JSV50_15485 [Desulfobacteraceae bacterium]